MNARSSTIINLPLIILILSFMTACGGGGSGTDNPPQPEDSKLIGQFIDSPVQGLRYETAARAV